MLRLHLVRHGETTASREDRYCGDVEVELTDGGRRSAEALAARFTGRKLDAVWASPKRRAQETAAPLAAAQGLPIRTDDGLREISYGQWEGLHRDVIAARWPEEFGAWEDDPADNAPTGGENGRAIAARAILAWERIRAATPAGEVVVVSHKATIRILVCTLLGIDLPRFRDRIDARTGSVTTFDVTRRGPLLVRLCDDSHLPPELRLP